MNASVSAVATTSFTISFIILQLVSLLFMIALLLQFALIHGRRIEVLQSLQSHKVAYRCFESRILGIVYVIFTLIITAFSTFIFLH
ncbi:hypothetical protein COU80_04470 [Candidatus Peregrinibacteria bacterium CG10_big_fil_rev_8_21_14_0_10_55_24]|nr:MAG: hypothetical protein COU80_04470 [Candidatus Peregrinibacteria bacterium CG10_big_fil_rev_8_21_14_0_10_55_24]